MSRLIPSYIEQALRIEVLERAVIASDKDYERMKVAAQAAYRAMVAMELSDGSKREWDTAIAGLREALAESTIQESLTVAKQEPSSSSPLLPLERAPHDSTTPCRTSQTSAEIGKTPLCPG